MTNASFCLGRPDPPAGSAVRVKSRLRRYSASWDSAVVAGLAGVAALFELVRFFVGLDFLGMGSFKRFNAPDHCSAQRYEGHRGSLGLRDQNIAMAAIHHQNIAM